MNIRTGWIACGCAVFTLSMAQAAELPGAGSLQAPSMPGQGHRSLIGTVTKTTDTMLTVETEEGTSRSFSLKAAKVDGISTLHPEDRVLLELDEENQIIGIHDIGEKHQLVRGEIVGIDRVKKIITLKLMNGTSQSYGMKEAMAGKMNNIEAGAVVMLMVDQRNHLAMDVHVEPKS